MGDWLKINSINIPVADETFDEGVREIGDITTAFNGAMIRSRRTTKRDMTFDTIWLESNEDAAWERFIRGEGEFFSFSTLYGSKGTAPDVGYSGVVEASNGPSGAPSLLVSTGTHVYTCLPSGGPYTVSLWYSNNSTPGAGYSYYTVNSASQKWVNGSRNDAASTTFMSVSGGKLTLTGGANRRFAYIHVFPWTTPTSWPPVFFSGDIAAGLVAQPSLRVTGDAIADGSARSMLGSVEGNTARVGGTSSVRRLKVTLTEN